MNKTSVQHWKHPMKEFLEVTRQMLQKVLLQQLDSVFVHYQQTALYSELKRIITKFLDQAYEELCDHAEENYFIEHSKPFTMAKGALEEAQERFLGKLKARRRTGRVNLYLDIQQSVTEQDELEPDQKRAAAAKITDADIGPDDFSKEVEIMAVSWLSLLIE